MHPVGGMAGCASQPIRSCLRHVGPLARSDVSDERADVLACCMKPTSYPAPPETASGTHGPATPCRSPMRVSQSDLKEPIGSELVDPCGSNYLLPGMTTGTTAVAHSSTDWVGDSPCSESHVHQPEVAPSARRVQPGSQSLPLPPALDEIPSSVRRVQPRPRRTLHPMCQSRAVAAALRPSPSVHRRATQTTSRWQRHLIAYAMRTSLVRDRPRNCLIPEPCLSRYSTITL